MAKTLRVKVKSRRTSLLWLMEERCLEMLLSQTRSWNLTKTSRKRKRSNLRSRSLISLLSENLWDNLSRTKSLGEIMITCSLWVNLLAIPLASMLWVQVVVSQALGEERASLRPFLTTHTTNSQKWTHNLCQWLLILMSRAWLEDLERWILVMPTAQSLSTKALQETLITKILTSEGSNLRETNALVSISQISNCTTSTLAPGMMELHQDLTSVLKTLKLNLASMVKTLGLSLPLEASRQEISLTRELLIAWLPSTQRRKTGFQSTPIWKLEDKAKLSHKPCSTHTLKNRKRSLQVRPLKRNRLSKIKSTGYCKKWTWALQERRRKIKKKKLEILIWCRLRMISSSRLSKTKREDLWKSYLFSKGRTSPRKKKKASSTAQLISLPKIFKSLRSSSKLNREMIWMPPAICKTSPRHAEKGRRLLSLWAGHSPAKRRLCLRSSKSATRYTRWRSSPPPARSVMKKSFSMLSACKFTTREILKSR